MKKHNIYKILTIAILASIAFSYFIPSTTISYGSAEKGTINPVTFADSFINGLTSFSAFMTIFIYVLVIGVFYSIFKKTGKFDAVVNNIAYKFRKNRSLLIVLITFIFSLITMFTGELYVLLIFVPLMISIIRKLGFSKETSVLVTIGSILIGNAGTLYSYYINQMLSLTRDDTLLSRIIIMSVLLVFLIAFVLIFDKKPEKIEIEKIKEKKIVPIYVILGLMFVFIILGFVNWESYFGFKGFSTFLENIRNFKIAKVSVFDTIIGDSSSIVPFGTYQLYHASVLFIFLSFIIAIINRVRINDLFDSVGNGLKKAFPYGLIIVMANLVLVNVFSSGIFYTVALGITKTTVNMATGTLTSIISGLVFPDYAYSVQFTLTSILNTSASDYEVLVAVLFQVIYSLMLLISPTSFILLMALRYTDLSYKQWIKYIYKFFIVLFITALVIVNLLVNKIDAASICALVLLIVAIIVIIYLFIVKKSLKNKNVRIEENKETKNIEVTDEKKDAPKKKSSKSKK